MPGMDGNFDANFACKPSNCAFFSENISPKPLLPVDDDAID
jgi:hypothetical protein